MRFLPRFRAKKVQGSVVTVNDIVRLVDDAFEAGYRTRKGRWHDEAKAQMFERLANDLRS